MLFEIVYEKKIPYLIIKYIFISMFVYETLIHINELKTDNI